jgi:NAD(P)-dependent dehydrogenase (short-subunit alcohol dehydrogenase family)
MIDLSGRVALVTGAGQGVGVGIAAILARQGAKVAVNDLFADRAGETASRIGGLAFPFDVTDFDAVRAGVARIESELGAVDILVNNAGIPAAGFPQVDFKDSDPDLWHRFVDLNLYGVMHCTHATLSGMCERGWGRVITVASDAGRVGAAIRVSLYGASKAAAIGLMKHVAYEVGPMGVTWNALSLGVMTGVPEVMARANAIPRLGQPAEVGYMAAFLASDEAAWITGQVIPVNGGAVT